MPYCNKNENIVLIFGIDYTNGEKIMTFIKIRMLICLFKP